MGKLALVLGCVAAASPNALCGSGFFVTTAGVATAPALAAAALYFLIVAPQVSALFESSDFRPRLAKLSVALSAALILIEYGALVALAVVDAKVFMLCLVSSRRFILRRLPWRWRRLAPSKHGQVLPPFVGGRLRLVPLALLARLR